MIKINDKTYVAVVNDKMYDVMPIKGEIDWNEVPKNPVTFVLKNGAVFHSEQPRGKTYDKILGEFIAEWRMGLSHLYTISKQDVVEIKDGKEGFDIDDVRIYRSLEGDLGYFLGEGNVPEAEDTEERMANLEKVFMKGVHE